MGEAERLIDKVVSGDTDEVSEASLTLAPSSDLVNTTRNIQRLLTEASTQITIALGQSRTFNKFLKDDLSRLQREVIPARRRIDSIVEGFEDEDY